LLGAVDLLALFVMLMRGVASIVVETRFAAVGTSTLPDLITEYPLFVRIVFAAVAESTFTLNVIVELLFVEYGLAIFHKSTFAGLFVNVLGKLVPEAL